MTTIATVPGINNKKLTDLVRSLIKYGKDDVRLIKALNVVIDGDTPRVETFSFDELEGLMNIVDLHRPIKVVLDPAQWVVITYQLEDLEELMMQGYLLTNYVLDLDADLKVLTFTGVIRHETTIPEHPNFNIDSTFASKEFEFVLEDFDAIQQMAITRAMASRDEKFNPVAGSIDVSWVYSFSKDGINFGTKEPA